MVQDLEVGVLLEPDTSELDKVEDREVETSSGEGQGSTGDGGGGLFTGTNIVLALLTGILGATKSGQELLGGLIRTINAIVAPVLNGIFQLIRPLTNKFLDIAAVIGNLSVGTVINEAFNRLINDLTNLLTNFINDLRNAINNIPGVDVPGGGGRNQGNQSNVQTATDLTTTGTDLALGRGTPLTPAAVNQFISEANNLLTTQVQDLQDEDKVEEYASWVQSKVDDIT